MRIVYALEETPESIDESIFLVGPTPREACSISWRAEMIENLIDADFNGTVFVPEPRNGHWAGDYADQIDWELKHLEMADVIIAWVPREMTTMPALTTNVEFGKFLSSGKVVYGRPETAEKCRYLDALYAKSGFGEPHSDMAATAQAAVTKLGTPMTRTGGERFVPLHIYRTEMFQKWLTAQKNVGNRLESAKVLWQYVVGKNYLFSYILQVNVWVESEKRFKSNEFTFTRRDISTILPFHTPVEGDPVLDAKIVLVKEFRSPCRNDEAFVYELPGGSSFKPGKSPLELAAEELAEETGLSISATRFVPADERQLASTLSTHTANLFAVELTEDEIKELESIAAEKTTFGVANDSEKTYVVVETMRNILDNDLVDWSTVGMITNVLLGKSSA